MLPPRKGFENQLDITVESFDAINRLEATLSTLGLRRNCYVVDHGPNNKTFSVLCTDQYHELIKKLNDIPGITYKAVAGKISGVDGVIGEVANSRVRGNRVYFLVEWPHKGPEWIARSKLRWSKRFNMYSQPLDKKYKKRPVPTEEASSQWDII